MIPVQRIKSFNEQTGSGVAPMNFYIGRPKFYRNGSGQRNHKTTLLF